MSTVALEPTAFDGAFDRFLEAEADVPAWLQDLRRTGMEQFRELGLPSSKNEEWLYTNPAPLRTNAFETAPPTASVPTSLAAHRFALGMDEGPRLVFLNGRYEASLSSSAGLPDGVMLTNLASEWNGASPDASSGSGRGGAAADAKTHPFVALNTAFLQDGVRLRLPRNAAVEQPIQILFLHTPTGHPVAVHPRIVVEAEEGSSATIVERYGIDCIGALAGGTCFTNAVSEYILDANASVRVLRLQREGTRTYHVGFTGVRQARDSRFASTAISLGGAIDRNEAQVELLEPGAECSLNGLYIISNEEHVDNHTVITHAVPHCRSEQLFKGILGGHARGAFTGRVVVAKDAQKTAAEQANHNLLLSEHAIAETRPQLEIYADDVQCAHGATIGRLDDEALYYLRSRGIGPVASRNLLVHAFASEITEAVGDERLTTGLEQLIAGRLAPDPEEKIAR